MISVEYLLLLFFMFEVNLFTTGKSIIHNLEQNIFLSIRRIRKQQYAISNIGLSILFRTAFCAQSTRRIDSVMVENVMVYGAWQEYIPVTLLDTYSHVSVHIGRRKVSETNLGILFL